MVSVYGLNDTLGNITYYDSSGQMENSFTKPYSEKTAQVIDKEISDICIKYNIIQSKELRNHTRNQVIGEIQKWVQYKKENYKQRRHSSPNISMNGTKSINTQNNDNSIIVSIQYIRER